MKKITFWLWASCCLAFVWQGQAQTLNENAGWPNAAWTITGTYNNGATAFEADPRTTANFAFDDDDAGNGSKDIIAAESPIIDLTAAFTAGEVWLNFTSTYVYNWFNANEKLALQYYDFDSATWIDWFVFTQQNESPTPPIDNFCNGTDTTIDSGALDISGFSATQLSNFRYRIYFNDNITGNAGWIYGFCFDSPTITSIAPPADILDYYNLQWPATGTIESGEEYNVYAQAYEAGLTDVASGQAPGVEVWIGYSTTDTDPSGAGWTWHVATFNAEVGNNDEYMLNLSQHTTAAGIYYYASRWRLNGGFYTYGGIQANGSYGGSWGQDNNGSGVLTVNGPENDNCLGAISLTVNNDYSCTVVTPGTTAGATPSGIDELACGGTENDDVWFSFVATATSHRISLLNTVGTSTDMYHSVWTGLDCGALALVPGSCSDADVSNRTGLTVGSTYYVRVYTWGSAANSTSFNICIGTPPPPPPPPANDDCVAATSVVQETSIATAAEATSTSGTIEGATFSGLPAEQCNNYTGIADDDVWYSFVALTESVNITYEVTGTAFDMVAQLYSGSCGTLVVEGCADATITTQPIVEQISATGLTVGQTYYTRMYQYGAGVSTIGKTFNVKVWSSEELSVNDAGMNSFKFHPNPVKNTLQLNAQSSIQNVAVFNMLGQEVFRTAPNNVESAVDMSGLQTGAYFVKVTINDRTETVRVIKY